MRAEQFVPAGFTSSDFPEVEAAMLPKGKAKARLSSTSTARSQKPVETGASSSGAATAKEPVAAGVESAGAFLRRGPPKIPNFNDLWEHQTNEEELDKVSRNTSIDSPENVTQRP